MCFVTFVVVPSIFLSGVRPKFFLFPFEFVLNLSSLCQVDCASMAFMDHDVRSFDRTIQIVQNHTKFNTIDILEKYKISSHKKAKMNIL
jgi:hypothetical protein